jgi:hypothetical protein
MEAKTGRESGQEVRELRRILRIAWEMGENRSGVEDVPHAGVKKINGWIYWETGALGADLGAFR